MFNARGVFHKDFKSKELVVKNSCQSEKKIRVDGSVTSQISSIVNANCENSKDAT